MKDVVTVRIESPAFEADAVRIAEITGTESISRLFELTLRLTALDPGALDEAKLMTSEVELVFERTDDTTLVVTEERRIGGIISTLQDRVLTETEHREVIATFVPRAWQTTLTRTTDIFMDMTIPEIVQKKLESGAGLGSVDVEMRLEANYPKREFVVQYKESDYAFICRLTEDLGIHFCFEKKGDRDVIVFGDANAAFKPAVPESVPFRKRGETIGVHEIEIVRRRVPRSFQARDYNYRNPSMDLLGEAMVPSLGSAGLVDEFGPHAKDGSEVTRYAQLRAEESSTRHLTFEGSSDLPGLRAGSVVKVEGHSTGDLELVIVEVEHHARQGAYGAAAADESYRNTFKAILHGTTFRPPLRTPKPIVHGVVTGIVQSASATDFGAVDEEGRYRVGFMYDTVTSREEGKASRPLRMTQPSAGAGRGFHQPLKAGTEVMVICLNGDPDRPMIVGAVPNPQTPSPVTSSNAEKSTWKTNVNQVEIDDNEPRINLTVDNSTHVIQIGAPHAPELGVYIASEENLTAKAKKVYTTVTKMKSSFTFKKLGTASADIVGAAGVPNPLSTWDNIVNAAKATADFASALGGMADAVEKEIQSMRSEVGAAKAAADKKLADKQKAVQKELAKQAAEDPKVLVDQKGGNARYETPEEAKERKYEGQLDDPKNEHLKQELADDAHEAAEAKKEFDETLLHVGEEADGLIEDGKELYGEIEEKVEKGLELYEEHKDKIAKVGEKIEEGVDWVRKKSETAQAIIAKAGQAKDFVKKQLERPKVKELISKLSGIFHKAAVQAADATVKATQKLSHAIPKASGQRRGDSVGDFASPHNIQMSRHSASLYGFKNTFVYGGTNMTMSSAGTTSVLARKKVDVKSTKQVEIASKEIFISAKEELDAWSGKHVKLVAHSSKEVPLPGGFSMLFHSKEGVRMESTDKNIDLKAKTGIVIKSETEGFQVRVKKGMAFLAEEEQITVMAQKKDISVSAKLGVKIEGSKENVTVEATAKNVEITAGKLAKIKSKTGEWTTEGDLKLNGKSFAVKASGSAKVNGSKIHLG